ncbi:hypothetical protein DMT18_21345 [Klebsiella variicola]|nr:hypothetical protein DMT18_21345 [Klebsiella variicola]
MRDLILQLSKSSIYSTKPRNGLRLIKFFEANLFCEYGLRIFLITNKSNKSKIGLIAVRMI